MINRKKSLVGRPWQETPAVIYRFVRAKRFGSRYQKFLSLRAGGTGETFSWNEKQEAAASFAHEFEKITGTTIAGRLLSIGNLRVTRILRTRPQLQVLLAATGIINCRIVGI